MRATAILICSSVLAVQAGTLPDSGGVVLRSTTRLVQVNVVAQKGGQPLAGLTRADFALTDNGKPQRIAFFAENQSRPLPAAPPLAPNTFTNRLEQRAGTPSAITVILLDSLNTKWADQAYARAQVIKFLEQIQPDDHIGIYTLGRSLRVLHDYTSDASELLRALAKSNGRDLPDINGKEPAGALAGDTMLLDQWLRGGGASGAERDFYTANRVTGTLRALEFIADHLARVPGRKNLIWVSGGFPLTIGFDSMAAWHDPAREQRTFGDEIDRTVRALNNAAVAIYPVDARGLMTDPRFSAARRGPVNPRRDALRMPVGARNQESMQELANRSGGRAYYNTNNLMGAIRDAVADSRLTYTIGYYPDDGKGDGKFHDLKLHVRESGVKLRYRKGYFDLPDQPQDEKVRRAELRDSVFSPLDATEIGLTVHVQPGPQGKLEVVMNVEPHGLGLQSQDGRWNGKLDVLLVQKDEQGRQYNGRNDTIEMRLQQATYDRVQSGGLTYRQTVDRAAQATQLRIVVRDAASGSVGSVTVPLNALKS